MWNACKHKIWENKKNTLEAEDHNFEIRTNLAIIPENYYFSTKLRYWQIITNYQPYDTKLNAKTLFSREIAREQGCGFLIGDCTSYFSATGLKSGGFQQIYALNYADYKPDGEVVFEPESPHDALTVFVKKI